jgi:hypothetical protein
MSQPVVHWEIMAKDFAKTKDFYSQLFGWQMMPFMDNYAYVVTGGLGDTGINGGILQAPPNLPPSVTFYVQVDDLAAYLKKAESLGGRTCVPPTPIPNIGSFAMFLDPDGMCIGIYKSAGGPQPEQPKQPGCPVIWFEIAGKDGKRLREFYSKLFDWQIKYDAQMDYGEIQSTGPRGIGGGIMTTKDPSGQFTYVTVYVQVDDLKKYLDKAVSLGGKVMLEAMPVPNVGTIAFLSDNEGRPLGLCKLHK